MFKEVADIKTSDQLHLPVPEAKFETVVVQPSEYQKDMVASLSERAADVHLRADNIEAFSKERNDEYVGRAEEYKAAKSALLEGLGLEHLFDHSHELTPKEKEIWMLFDRVDVAELLARDAFAKGAYMLGAEDREIMLK